MRAGALGTVLLTVGSTVHPGVLFPVRVNSPQAVAGARPGNRVGGPGTVS
jgi:hypothetical protein